MSGRYLVYVDGNPAGEFEDFSAAFAAMHDGAKAGSRAEIMSDMETGMTDTDANGAIEELRRKFHKTRVSHQISIHSDLMERVLEEVDALTKSTVDSASDERTVNNTVRHQYRTLTADEKSAMMAVKDAGAALIGAIEALPPCRESSIGVTKAEEAVMWAVKGLTK